MSHLSMRDELVSQGAFRAESELVFGGLAVNEESRAARLFGGSKGASAVALFADNEKQSEIAAAVFEEPLGGGDHGGDDALGIAGSASPDALVIFARGEEWGNGVHVSRQGDVRTVAPLREDVEAARLDFHALDSASMTRGESGEV